MLTISNDVEAELYKDFYNVAIIMSLRYIAKTLPIVEREQLFRELEDSFDMRVDMLMKQTPSEIEPIVTDAVANVKPMIANIITHLKAQVQ